RKLVEEKHAFTDYGFLFESGEFSGMPSEQARLTIAAEAQRRGIGQPAVNYHLRDWGVSRQRYWGTPIPIVYCLRCDPEHAGIPVPDADLPVVLPDIDVKEVLTGKGEPPLAKVASWVNTTCPKCGGPARREAETMDTFVDSTWYFARYLDPHNDAVPFSRAQADRWLPVDVYVGGCAVSEPAQKLVTQGIVKGRDGEKMSKSKGNVVSPREIIAEFGADTARLFILFAAPAEKDMDWSDEQVQGQHRFLGRVWRLVQASLPKIQGAKGAEGGDELRRRTHKTILRVTQQLERLQFNTAISSLMELSNAATDWQGDPSSLRESLEVLVQLLAPFAPHIANELWPELGRSEELSTLHWPEADPSLVVDDAYQIAVQVNGKLRGEVQVAATAGEAEIRSSPPRPARSARASTSPAHTRTLRRSNSTPRRHKGREGARRISCCCTASCSSRIFARFAPSRCAFALQPRADMRRCASRGMRSRWRRCGMTRRRPRPAESSRRRCGPSWRGAAGSVPTRRHCPSSTWSCSRSGRCRRAGDGSESTGRAAQVGNGGRERGVGTVRSGRAVISVTGTFSCSSSRTLTNSWTSSGSKPTPESSRSTSSF
ncbi:MAG: hypothetical protein E6J88_02835, partial [Deltaproteobacteria bacterium]